MDPEVQQRGIGATKSILLQLLDGMHSGSSDPEPVLVVDLLPSRPTVLQTLVSYSFIVNDDMG